MNNKNRKVRLALSKQTIATLSRESMQKVLGATCEACESILLSCDPVKWFCGMPDTDVSIGSC